MMKRTRKKKERRKTEMTRNNNGWIVVSEGPTGVYYFVGDENAVPADLPTESEVKTGSVAVRNGTGTKYLYHETDGWKEWS